MKLALHRLLPLAALLLLAAGCEKDKPLVVNPPQNHAPVITSLTADTYEVMSGHSVMLTCTAEDEDGDSLAYSWNTQQGSFLAGHTAATVEWTPPYVALTATIFVDVSDGADVVTDSLQIVVSGIDPRIPRFPTPLDGDGNISLLPTLTWSVGEDVTEPLTYDLFFGPGQDLPRIAEGLTDTTYHFDRPLQPNVTYRWRVAAVSQDGSQVIGATWRFDTRTLTFGPPEGPALGTIAFFNYKALLATIEPGSEEPVYMHRVGTQQFASQPSQVIEWNPGYSSSSEPAIALYDLAEATLYLLNEAGQGVKVWDTALPHTYAFSKSGSSFAYARESGNTQELVSEGVPPIIRMDVLGNVPGGYVFSSLPSYNLAGTTVAIAATGESNPDYGKLVVYRRGEGIIYQSDMKVWSPQFGPLGNHTAWLEAEGSSTSGAWLVIGDETFVEQHRYDLSSFGAGCTALSWSPDGMYIAMYAAIHSDTPSLLLYSVADLSLSAMDLGLEIAVPEGVERPWARPSWNSDGSQFTICTRTSNGYALIAVSPSGSAQQVVDGLYGATNTAWFRGQ